MFVLLLIPIGKLDDGIVYICVKIEELICFRSRRLQPVHIPFTTRIHRHRPGLHIPAFRSCDFGQGVHRQTNEPVQVLWFRVFWQRDLGTICHKCYARIPDRHQEAQSAAKTYERGVQTVLNETCFYQNQRLPSASVLCARAPISGSVAAIYTNCEIFLLVKLRPAPHCKLMTNDEDVR